VDKGVVEGGLNVANTELVGRGVSSDSLGWSVVGNLGFLNGGFF